MPQRMTPEREWRLLLGGVLAAVAISVLALTIAPSPVSITGGVTLVALAAFGVGGLIGFLFGLPRAQRPELRPKSPSAASDASAADQPRYVPNTNLEDVADWLTKILVGLGLTQLGGIPDRFRALAAYSTVVAGADPRYAPAMAGLLLVTSIVGFFVAYLWARMRLGAALALADAEQLHEQVDRFVRRSVRTEGVAEQALRLGQTEEQARATREAARGAATGSESSEGADETGTPAATRIVGSRENAAASPLSRGERERAFLLGWDRLNANATFAQMSDASLSADPAFTSRSPADLPGARRWFDRNQSALNDLRITAGIIAAAPNAIEVSDVELDEATRQVAALEDSYVAAVAGGG